MSSHRLPAESRAGRIVAILHRAGTAGVTVKAIVEQLDPPIKRGDVNTLLKGLQREKKAACIALRRASSADVDQRTQEVWACKCRLGHTPPQPKPYESPRLDDATKERGLTGIAAARAALDTATTERKAG